MMLEEMGENRGIVKVVTEGDNYISLDSMVGDDPSMKQVKEKARKVAFSESSILIVGETGTGKGLLARAIHELGRRSGAFVTVNCAART